MDGITSKKRTVNGIYTSLKDLGYVDVGLDDAWFILFLFIILFIYFIC